MDVLSPFISVLCHSVMLIVRKITFVRFSLARMFDRYILHAFIRVTLLAVARCLYLCLSAGIVSRIDESIACKKLSGGVLVRKLGCLQK